jgi:molecular chaperone DnaK
MVQEAQSHAEEDKRRREVVDLRNQLDNLAYSLEKLVKENREKLGEDEAKRVEEAVAEARKTAAGDDASEIRAALGRLTDLSHKAAETLYKTAAPAGTDGEAQGGGKGTDGNVVDAEYTVKN